MAEQRVLGRPCFTRAEASPGCPLRTTCDQWIDRDQTAAPKLLAQKSWARFKGHARVLVVIMGNRPVPNNEFGLLL